MMCGGESLSCLFRASEAETRQKHTEQQGGRMKEGGNPRPASRITAPRFGQQSFGGGCVASLVDASKLSRPMRSPPFLPPSLLSWS